MAETIFAGTIVHQNLLYYLAELTSILSAEKCKFICDINI